MKSKKNICLLHGWGGSIGKLEPLKKALESNSWNVLSLKMPFFDVAEPKSSWSVNDFVEYVTKKCKRHFDNEAYFIFGHSNGGRIAMKTASNTKLNNTLEGIILCSSAGISRDSILKRFPLLILSKLLKIVPHSKTIRKIPYILAGNQDYYNIPSETKRETFKRLISENLKKHAKHIEVPTLILWGNNDHLTPVKDAYWLNKNIPHSKIHIYNNEKHGIPYTIPSEIATEINKWTQSL